MIALKTGDVVAAKRWSTKSLRVHQEHFPERRYAVQALEERAWVEAVAEQPERIAVLLGAASRERERMGVPIPRSVQLEYDRYMPMAQSMIGAVIWDRAWQRGRELSLVESIAFALADEE